MTRSSFVIESNLHLNIKQIGVTLHHVVEMSWFVRKIARDLPATHGNIHQKYTTRKNAQNLNVVVRK